MNFSIGFSLGTTLEMADSTTTPPSPSTSTQKPKENKNTLKYVSLITLTLQNAILTLSMRYARTRATKDELFYNTTGE